MANLSRAGNAPASLADALVRDSDVALHFRSHYLDRDRKHGADSRAWAAGGWLSYRSGWVGDTFGLGLTAYASQKLYGPPDRDGTALLKPGQQSYAVLGESYGALKYREHVLSAGRFLVNQLEVNPQDTRMSPRTFQGVALAGKLGRADYYLARLEKMKSRNWDVFEPVATVAGAPAAMTEPLLLISVSGAPHDRLKLRFSSYRLRDLLASTYADASWLAAVSADTRLQAGVQYLRQGSTGNHRLTGAAFDTWTVGVKADLIHGSLTLSAIAMKTDEGAAYRTPFGSWQGYASRIINNFNRAGEKVYAVDAALDFSRLGAPGLSLLASATVGRDAIDAGTGAGLPVNTEYDLTADYRFTASAWPQWARPLGLRARFARFKQQQASRMDVMTETHLILNYVLEFK